MARNLPCLLAIALSAGLALPAAAAAVGVGDARAVDRPARGLVSSSPLIASAETCPGQDDPGAPAVIQERAMACLVDYARREFELPPISQVEALTDSAQLKTQDIVACGDFSHYACGRPFSHWIHESGYTSTPCWEVGENIGWGRGGQGTARSIFAALMRSATHRENILGAYEHIGIDSRVGSVGFLGQVRVWAQHFGTHCGAPPA